MALQLLKRLSGQRLPAVLDRPTDLEELVVLVLAGQAKANISESVRTLHGYERPPATVLEITRLGRQALATF